MNAIEVAIQLKSKAIEYYKKALIGCRNPSGKRMFEVILKDEEHHLESLQNLLNNIKVDIDKLKPIKNVKDAFESLKYDMRVRKACSLDDVEAFRIAMDMERECLDFFRKQAAKSNSDYERTLLTKIAHEEEEHFKIFANTYDFLNDTGNWFMWEDHSIVEGG